MNPSERKALLKEYWRRKVLRDGACLVDKKYPPQAKFVMDESKSIVAQCTRRAGKSYAAGLRLFRAAIKKPGSIALYIALTRKSAELIMWPVLDEINRRYMLEAELTLSNLTVTLKNGSRVILVGADTKNFIERLRGPKYSEAIIDEAGSFRSHLENLIDDVLTPALLDYNGALVLQGTPGILPIGAFHDACTKDQGYTLHKWSLLDNPYLPNAAEYLRGVMKKRGWTDQNPTYRREYMGEWVIDLDALVYKFKTPDNVYHELPQGHDYVRILSIDYGWNDATAFGVIAYSHTLREVFIEHAEGHSEMVPSDIAARINQLREKWKPIRIVADTGGLGKSITEEFIRRYSIAIKPAEKTEKLTNIALMNGDFIDKRLWVHASLKELHDQYMTLSKGDDGMEDPSLPNDLADCCLYGWREALHYLGETPAIKPKEGTQEWGRLIEKQMLEEAEAEHNRPAADWWDE